MKSAIDSAGRVVIPKALWEPLGLAGGGPVEIREREGRIEIEPANRPMALVRRAGGLVAVPEQSLPALTGGTVRATLKRSRQIPER